MSTLKFLKEELALLHKKQVYLREDIDRHKEWVKNEIQEYETREELIHCLQDTIKNLEKENKNDG